MIGKRLAGLNGSRPPVHFFRLFIDKSVEMPAARVLNYLNIKRPALVSRLIGSLRT